MPLIKWEKVQLPRLLGGLSVGNILHRNIALLSKWIWRYFTEPESLWRGIIQCKYNYPDNFRVTDLQTPKAGGPWKSLCATI